MRPGAAPFSAEPMEAQSSPISGILIASTTLTASGGTPSATLARQLSRWLNAAITPVATLAQRTSVVLLAASTPVATLTRQTGVYLAAAVAPLATLTVQTRLVLTAAVTPLATMIKNVYVTLAAAVPMTGVLARVLANIKRYRARDLSGPQTKATDESRALIASTDASQGDPLP